MWDTPTFCGRCCRGFNREIDKAKHVSMSPKHYVCYMCSHRPDFVEAYQLRQHEDAKHYWCGWCSELYRDEEVLRMHRREVHFFCSWCSLWFQNIFGFEYHNDESHFSCSMCDQLFENENNRRMHLRAHAPRDKQCPGVACYRYFDSFSAILIHLESGTCASQVDLEDIDQLAHRCYQARHYTNPYGMSKYRCPNCSRGFELPSALFQHAETTLLCQEQLEPGYYLEKLEHWIEINV